MENTGKTLAADQILADVWGSSYAGESGLVAIYMRRLRAKLEPDATNPIYILSPNDQTYRIEGRPTLSQRQVA